MPYSGAALRFVQDTLDAASSNLVVLDAQGFILFANKRWRDFAQENGGDLQKHFVGQNYLAVCDAASGEDSAAASSMAQGIREVIAGTKDDFSIEYFCDLKGECRWFVARVTRFFEGNVVRVVVTHEDINERKRIEIQLTDALESVNHANRKNSEVVADLLHKQETMYALTDSMPDYVFFKDLQGRFLRINSALAKRFGLASASDAIGKSDTDFYPSDFSRQTAAIEQQIMDKKVALVGFVEKVIWPDGSESWSKCSKMPLYDMHGYLIGTYGMATDVTELVEIQNLLWQANESLESRVTERTIELEQVNQELADQVQQTARASLAKTEFLSNMSHEIRTPLSAIIGMASLIRKDPLTDTQNDKLKKLESAAKHLTAVINDILDLSKIEANKLLLEDVPLVVDEIFVDVASMLQTSVHERGLAMQFDLRAIPRELFGDPTRLRQALLNFANNAVKFTSNGSITLRARIQEETSDSVLLRLEVSDTGLGIAPENLTDIFLPFTQADNTITRSYGGTGLGLAITKRLAEAMDGEVGVHSEVGKGSTFWLTARLRKSQSTNNQIEDKFDVHVAENLRSTFAGRRVLIAEDDDFNREIATILLEDVGLCVDVAEDGQFALEMAGKRVYDLILMDIQMPKLDGLSATRQIRKSTTGSEVPIIAMTANAFVEDRVRCIEAGMTGFLTKPIDTRALYHTLFTQLSSNGIKGVALE